MIKSMKKLQLCITGIYVLFNQLEIDNIPYGNRIKKRIDFKTKF